jgi:Mg2+ and Co2+ transporter CorA
MLQQLLKVKAAVLYSSLQTDCPQPGTLQSLSPSSSSPHPHSPVAGLSTLSSVQTPYLRDLADHISIMLATVDGATTMLEALQNTYLSQLQLRAESMARQINHTMKRFAAISIVLLPLSLISRSDANIHTRIYISLRNPISSSARRVGERPVPS